MFINEKTEGLKSRDTVSLRFFFIFTFMFMYKPHVYTMHLSLDNIGSDVETRNLHNLRIGFHLVTTRHDASFSNVFLLYNIR